MKLLLFSHQCPHKAFSEHVIFTDSMPEQARQHSSRMHTTRLEAIHASVSVATTRYYSLRRGDRDCSPIYGFRDFFSYTGIVPGKARNGFVGGLVNNALALHHILEVFHNSRLIR